MKDPKIEAKVQAFLKEAEITEIPLVIKRNRRKRSSLHQIIRTEKQAEWLMMELRRVSMIK